MTSYVIKKFFKPSAFKIVLTLIIAVLPLLPNFFCYDCYDLGMDLSKGSLGSEPNLGIKIVNYISRVLFFPWYFVSNPFLRALERIFGSFFFLRHYYLNYIVLMFYFGYCYMLGCVVSLLINRNTRKR